MEITKWDYCTVQETNIETLKELGKQGWEGFATGSGNCRIILKRPCGKITIREVPSQEQNRSSGYER